MNHGIPRGNKETMNPNHLLCETRWNWTRKNV